LKSLLGYINANDVFPILGIVVFWGVLASLLLVLRSRSSASADTRRIALLLPIPLTAMVCLSIWWMELVERQVWHLVKEIADGNFLVAKIGDVKDSKTESDGVEDLQTVCEPRLIQLVLSEFREDPQLRPRYQRELLRRGREVSIIGIANTDQELKIRIFRHSTKVGQKAGPFVEVAGLAPHDISTNEVFEKLLGYNAVANCRSK